MSSRRRTNWRLTPNPGGLDIIARVVVERHQWLIDSGFVLCGKSGVWRRRDGSLTIRMVYRRSDGVSWVYSSRVTVAGGAS